MCSGTRTASACIPGPLRTSPKEGTVLAQGPRRTPSSWPGTTVWPLWRLKEAPQGAMPTTCLRSLLLLPFANMAGEEGTEQVLVPVSAEAPRDAINS